MSRRLIQMYRIVSEHTKQLYSLLQAVNGIRGSVPSSTRLTTSSESASQVSQEHDNHTEVKSEDEASVVSEIFLDCVSRFSSQDVTTSIQRAHSSFSGSPDYWFEQRAHFYPEKHISADFSRSICS